MYQYTKCIVEFPIDIGEYCVTDTYSTLHMWQARTTSATNLPFKIFPFFHFQIFRRMILDYWCELLDRQCLFFSSKMILEYCVVAHHITCDACTYCVSCCSSFQNLFFSLSPNLSMSGYGRKGPMWLLQLRGEKCCICYGREGVHTMVGAVDAMVEWGIIAAILFNFSRFLICFFPKLC